MGRTWTSALPRTVVVLGLVSLANDSASDMITPLLPVFLTAVLGAGPAVVGLVEGVAEAAASILKAVSGRMVDRGVGARRLVLAGYGTSNLVRPAIALAFSWAWVLVLRFLDRMGKGLRTAPRDAMIAGAVPEGLRGRAFGFHRAADHAGAVLGPLAAFLLLAAGATIQQVFLWSLLPGVGVVLLVVFGLPADQPVLRAPSAPFRWRALDRRLRGLVVASGLLALAAVPEVFIVVWATAAGLPVAWVPLAWALASLAKMSVVLPAGWLSDRVGRFPVLIGGWALRIGLLLALAAPSAGGVRTWVLFVAYAASLACTEAPERSLVGDTAPKELRGTAFGIYHLATGVLLLPGALLFGVLWQALGSATAFRAAAAVTLLGALAMAAIVLRRDGHRAGN